MFFKEWNRVFTDEGLVRKRETKGSKWIFNLPGGKKFKKKQRTDKQQYTKQNLEN